MALFSPSQIPRKTRAANFPPSHQRALAIGFATAHTHLGWQGKHTVLQAQTPQTMKAAAESNPKTPKLALGSASSTGRGRWEASASVEVRGRVMSCHWRPRAEFNSEAPLRSGLASVVCGGHENGPRGCSTRPRFPCHIRPRHNLHDYKGPESLKGGKTLWGPEPSPPNLKPSHLPVFS